MPRYRYKAVDQEGKKVQGMVDAPDPDAVVSKLRQMGFYPVSVKRETSGSVDFSEMIGALPGFQWLLNLFSGKKKSGGLNFSKPKSYQMLEPSPKGPSVPDGDILAFQLQEEAIVVQIVRLEGDSAKLRSEYKISLGSGATLVNKFDAALTSVRRLIERNDLPSENCLLSVPNGRWSKKKLVLPKASPDRMLRMLEYEVKKSYPPEPHLVYFCDPSPWEDENTVNVPLFTLEHELLKMYLRIAEGLSMSSVGLFLAGADLSFSTQLAVHELGQKTEAFGIVVMDKSESL